MIHYRSWGNKNKPNRGFTFVELIVSIGILLILVGLIVFVLNPLKQINKAFDGRRLADLSSFTSVFETYYNDNQHFPTSVPFGSIWKQGNTVYMSSTPQDPQGTNNGGYIYMTDGSSTPQWAVMFSKLSNANSSATTTCELSPSCAPAGYIPSQWACKVYGTVSCSSLTSQSLPGTTIISQGTQNNSNGISNTNSSATSNATGSATSSPTGTQQTNQNSMTQVTLCHYNSSNSYIKETTGATSNVGGHDGHPNDIIPPFTYSCTSGICRYPGKNWTNFGQATYNNNCVIPFSSGNQIIYAYGQDGSTCEMDYPADMFQNGYCKDSTGFDSRINGQNVCHNIDTQSTGNAFTKRYNCYRDWYSSSSWGVKCSAGVDYNCAFYGNACTNNVCSPKISNSNAPVIQITSPTDGTQVFPNESTTFTIQVVQKYASIYFAQLYVSGLPFSCTPGGDATTYTCQWSSISQNLEVPNLQDVRVQAFVLDQAGNQGYAEIHLHY